MVKWSSGQAPQKFPIKSMAWKSHSLDQLLDHFLGVFLVGQAKLLIAKNLSKNTRDLNGYRTISIPVFFGPKSPVSTCNLHAPHMRVETRGKLPHLKLSKQP